MLYSALISPVSVKNIHNVYIVKLKPLRLVDRHQADSARPHIKTATLKQDAMPLKHIQILKKLFEREIFMVLNQSLYLIEQGSYLSYLTERIIISEEVSQETRLPNNDF